MRESHHRACETILHSVDITKTQHWAQYRTHHKYIYNTFIVLGITHTDYFQGFVRLNLLDLVNLTTVKDKNVPFAESCLSVIDFL